MVLPAAKPKRQATNAPHNHDKIPIHTRSPSPSFLHKQNGRSSRRSSWWSRREGAGPLPANRQHQSYHEEGAAKQCQDSKGREGRHPGVRVRVHWLHHQRVSAAVLIAWSANGLVGFWLSGKSHWYHCSSNSATAPPQQQHRNRQQHNSSSARSKIHSLLPSLNSHIPCSALLHLSPSHTTPHTTAAAAAAAAT